MDHEPRHNEPDTSLIYAIGDIHGHFDQLISVLTQARNYHQTEHSHRSALLVTLGDYVDRGPQSRQVLDFLINGGEELDWFDRRVHLRGNHEEMMLRALQNVHPYDFERWEWNGGVQTMESYGANWPDPDGDDFNSSNPLELLKLYVPETHVQWLGNRPYIFEYGPFLFVHAGIVPGVPIEDQKPKDFLWIRDEFLDYEGSHPKCIVHGHTPEDFIPTSGQDRICLDTAVYEPGGQLTCGVIDPTCNVGTLHEYFQSAGNLSQRRRIPTSL